MTDTFNALVEKYTPLLRATAAKYCGMYSFDELYQEALIGLWKAAVRHDGDGSFQAYAGTKVRGNVLNYIRSAADGSRYKKPPVFVLDGDAHLSTIAADAEESSAVPRTTIDMARYKRRILKALRGKFKPDWVGVFEDRVYTCAPWADTQRTYSIAKGTIHLRMTRMMEWLINDSGLGDKQ